MNRILIIMTLLFSQLNTALAGGSVWPGVKYDYAMVYVYNLDGNLRGNHQILKDGKLSPTVEGEGKKLSMDQASHLEKIFASGAAIDELLVGLSGCYIPRHAIVYYNEKNEAVASMSICFECGGIRFYSPSYPRNHYSSSPKLVKKAEEKLNEIKVLIESLGLKTEFKKTDEKTATPDSLIVNQGTMFFTNNAIIDSLFPPRITLENFRQYMIDDIDIRIFTDEKYTHGGQKFVFSEIYKGKSALLISGPKDNTSLESAAVLANDVTLLRNVKIGMSTEEVQGLFLVYDGIAYPSEITIQNEAGTKKIVFMMSENKLTQYTLAVTAW